MGLRDGTSSVDGSPRGWELWAVSSNIPALRQSRSITIYTHRLRKLAGWLRKDLNAVCEQDLREVLKFLGKGRGREDGGRFSQGTVHGYRVALKRLCR